VSVTCGQVAPPKLTRKSVAAAYERRELASQLADAEKLVTRLREQFTELAGPVWNKADDDGLIAVYEQRVASNGGGKSPYQMPPSVSPNTENRVRG
jgi:maltooligosyltrehalose synthase